MGRLRVVAAAATLGAAGCAGTRPHTGTDMDVGVAPAGVSVTTTVQYYDVNAATVTGIRQAISSSGPRNDGRSWGAVTTWNFRWTYQTARAGAAGCQVRDAQVRVTLLTTFPRWNPAMEPDSSVVEWWRQYAAGLSEHERGHASLAVQGGAAIARALRGTQALCDQMRDRTSVVANQVLEEIRASQLAYDRDTRHGGTQIQRARGLREP